MNRMFTLILLLLVQASAWAQDCPSCTTSLPSLPTDTIFMETLPDATVGTYYEAAISFRMPLTTTPVAATDPTVAPGITIDAITVTGMSNVPTGIAWTASQTTFDLPDETDGCITFCGTPLVAGVYEINVTLTAQVSILQQNSNVIIRLLVHPPSSVSEGFTITNTEGCESVTAFFENNIPSNGQAGYTYQWDFGNGLLSDLENPPAQTYTEVGSYPIYYQATIDTIGYILTQVTVHAAACDDIAIPLVTNGEPELYIRILDEEGNWLYESGFTEDTAPPVTFDFYLPLQTGNLRLEIRDEDGGIDGGDDLCGTINFNLTSNGTHSNGDVEATLNIIHPVTVIESVDTVTVHAMPAAPVIADVALETTCEGDNLRLVVTNYDTGILWYQDGMVIGDDIVHTIQEPGTYWATYTNEHGCISESIMVEYDPSPLPAAPAFTNTNNVLTLFDTTALPASYALQWYFESTAIEDGTGFSICAAASGTYILEVTDLETGCVNSFSSNIIWNSAYDCTTSTQTVANSGLSMFPNPTTDMIQIRTTYPIEHLRIWSASGTLVLEQEMVQQNHLTIDCTAFSAGMYFVEIRKGNTLQATKFIKK